MTDVDETLPPITLRACAAGGGFWAGHNSTSFGGNFFCPLHLWSLMHNFDPQPGPGVIGRPVPENRVKFIDGSIPIGHLHANRYEREYVVLARDGDRVTLRPLGDPNAPTFGAHVANLYSADPGRVYRYAARCGPVPAGAS